ncbi:SDR family NAD(P)-dependent oxidoreductase [Streptomyces sp. NPDC002779]|uniref:SDR family NAD(P)-dependent oxidoreductase n=1 Tax=Streptomyces sp. NPDC002779 TaxID=3364664 RepID=UPI003681C70F
MPAWRAATAPGLVLSGLQECVRITDDESGVAPALAEVLRGHGMRVDVVGADELGREPRGQGCVVLLDALSDPRHPAQDSAEVHGRLLRALTALAPRDETDAGGARSVVLVQDSGGPGPAAPPGRAWLGGAVALARTAHQEWPRITVKGIDCVRGGRPAADVAGALAAELLTGGGEPEVALTADGRRHHPHTEPAPPLEPVETSRTAPDPFFVVTGGARGITAPCLVELARLQRPRLLLLGRSALVPERPGQAAEKDDAALIRSLLAEDRETGAVRTFAEVRAEAGRLLAAREIRHTLAQLENAGAQVRYSSVDVRDEKAVRTRLEEARDLWGPVTGLVHAAGVVADKMVADKTPEQFERVFSTKVESLRVLLDATADDPLDTICLFSSISATVGNPGQSDYAMANAVLDHVAGELARERPAARVVSIAWGAWHGGMVTPPLREHFARQGVALLPVAEGARAFAAELAATSGPSRIVVVPDPGQPGQWGGASDRTGTQIQALVRAGAQRRPLLRDHAIGGRVVAPLALATEWMARAVPGRVAGAPFALHHIHVRRPITLGGPEPHWLTVEAVRQEDRAWHMSVGPVDDRAHITALAVPDRPPAAPRQDRPARPGPSAAAPRYGVPPLFHGPDFHVIDEILDRDDGGVHATVRGLRAMGWSDDGRWATDPALFDAALQLSLLWAQGVLGPTLPMRVERCEIHRPGAAPAGPLTCSVTARSCGPLSADCDALLLDTGGGVRAALTGIRLIALPG